MPRTLEEIRANQADLAVVRSVVDVLHSKLQLASRYGMYEYEAADAGQASAAKAFRDLAAQDREAIAQLLQLLPTQPDQRPGSLLRETSAHR